MQDESRRISENSTWGIRRKYEKGKVTVNCTKFLGYDKGEDGSLAINEKQAKIVRRIYTDYLDGKGTNRIARELEAEGVLNWNGKAKWYESTIRTMLSNEKYKGDSLLQKTYTVDFLSKKRAKNNGEVPQYYVEESHSAIINKDMWEAVQLDMERRVIWRCNKKYAVKGEKSCESNHIDNRVLYHAFVGMFNSLVENKDHFMEKWNEGLQSDNVLMKYKTQQFIKIFDDSEVIEEFDIDIYFKMIEKMIVFQGNKIIVTLLDSTEIEVVIE